MLSTLFSHLVIGVLISVATQPIKRRTERENYEEINI